jgi:hypothetical protein
MRWRFCPRWNRRRLRRSKAHGKAAIANDQAAAAFGKIFRRWKRNLIFIGTLGGIVARMSTETLGALGWAIVFVMIGAVLGITLVLLAAAYVPRLLDRLTPNIDEGREIVRGNTAVAQYFGLICGSCILGLSIVIAAAVLAGVIAALH